MNVRRHFLLATLCVAFFGGGVAVLSLVLPTPT